MSIRCEDYPCCGHTPADPCDPQDPGYDPYSDEDPYQHDYDRADYDDYEPECEDGHDCLDCHGGGGHEWSCQYCDRPCPQGAHDEPDEPDLDPAYEHDSTMISAGWGTDEDYGYFGDSDFFGEY